MADTSDSVRRHLREFCEELRGLQPEDLLATVRTSSTPQGLRQVCTELRFCLMPGNTERNSWAYRFPHTHAELWAAMDRIGGNVPPRRSLLNDDADLIRQHVERDDKIANQFFQEVFRTLDEVINWCDAPSTLHAAQIQSQTDELRNADLSVTTTRKAFELWRTFNSRSNAIRADVKDESERHNVLTKLKELDYLCASILCHFCEQNGIDPRSVKYGGKASTGKKFTGGSLMPDGRKQWEHDADLIGMAIRTAEAKALAANAGVPPPPAVTSAGEGEPLTGAERDAAFQELAKAVRQAYLSYQFAESKKGCRLEDNEAHELLAEEGISVDQGNLGELIDYDLPNVDTWSRQLRIARNALREQKYKRRGGRRTGTSIVKPDRLSRKSDRTEKDKQRNDAGD